MADKDKIVREAIRSMNERKEEIIRYLKEQDCVVYFRICSKDAREPGL